MSDFYLRPTSRIHIPLSDNKYENDVNKRDLYKMNELKSNKILRNPDNKKAIF